MQQLPNKIELLQEQIKLHRNAKEVIMGGMPQTIACCVLVNEKQVMYTMDMTSYEQYLHHIIRELELMT